MFEKRHRITLLFNANKAYDRQVVEGVGEYLQAAQLEWDIFIEEDFRARIENIKEWLGDGVIADYDDPEIEKLLADVNVPIIGVGGSYHQPERYPPVHYIATDNAALVESAFLHLKEKGVHRFAFYGLPTSSGKRWAVEREHAFCQLVAKEKYRGVVYQGLETAPENWQHAQNRLADWLQTLPRKPASSPSPTLAPAMFCRPVSGCIFRCRKNSASSASITRSSLAISPASRSLPSRKVPGRWATRQRNYCTVYWKTKRCRYSANWCRQCASSRGAPPITARSPTLP